VVNVSEEAKAWMAQKGYDPHFGARPMARLIQQEIETVLADEVLFGKLSNGGEVAIGLQDDKLTFEYT
jgi:ATP-dependent Clp protease ATP-binding subunit ClpA